MWAGGLVRRPGFEVFAVIRRDSVPVRLIGRQVRVLLHTNDLVISTAASRPLETTGSPANSKPTSNSTTTSRH